MARTVKPLTATQVEKAKPQSKPYKMFDGGGLFVLVAPAGGKHWRLKYRFEGKEKILTLGSYPAVSLLDARHARDAARRLLAKDIDPQENRKAAKQADSKLFEALATAWINQSTPKWSAAHGRNVNTLLKLHILPALAGRPVGKIKPVEISNMLDGIGRSGTPITARKAKTITGQILRYAISKGLAEHNPVATIIANDLPSLKNLPVNHHAAPLTIKDLVPILRAIDSCTSGPEVKTALQLAPLLMLRPGNLCQLEWSEVNFETGQIELPKEKMKRKKLPADHIVPLPRQAIVLLRNIQPFTGDSPYVFKSRRSNKPIEVRSLNTAFRRMGLTKDQVTAHGLARATTRTMMDEILKQRPDLIEHQLHHVVKDPNGNAYNRTKHLDGRAEMLQQWADFIDQIKRGADVIPLHRAA